MTSITLKVNGAEIQASVAGTLTSGMVGIPVTIEYDEAWEGLTKNLVCRCSRGTDREEHRTILNVGNTTVVAHEVMKAGMILYLGVEGCNADGTLVIPTTWAMCGAIEKGANTGEDLSADPTLPIWGQLQEEIEQLKEASVTSESFHIGPDEPAGESRPLYWLDTGMEQAPADPGEKTMTGITAVYTGGEVAVGTAVSALTGITVTASYSDGTTEAVTGYTLSGTIIEGSNTVTVTYQGKTATFTVTGVAQGGGDGEWEDVVVTNLGSASLTWYSDDGATQLAKLTKARSHTAVFDADTEVKIALVLAEAQYGTFYVGMMSPGATTKVYYAEAFSNDYPYNANKTYERTFTVRAGYALAVGGWSAATVVKSLTVQKEVV